MVTYEVGGVPAEIRKKNISNKTLESNEKQGCWLSLFGGFVGDDKSLNFYADFSDKSW